MMERSGEPGNGEGAAQTANLEEGRQSTAAIRYEVTFSPHALPRVLLIMALVLLAAHAVLAIYHYRVEELSWLLLQLFDVDEENNLPTWFSGSLLLTTSAFLWLCARKKRADADPWFRQWYALAVGFLLMSIDEVAGIHETINTMIEPTWAIAGGIVALVIGLAFVPFLLHLPRGVALLFVLAGAAYIGGAIGMEFVGDPMSSDTLEYNLTTLVEEGLEMLGVILFLHTLLRYMRGSGANAVDASLELR